MKCKWPGVSRAEAPRGEDPPDYPGCDAQADRSRGETFPYCKTHARRAYVPLKDKAKAGT